MANAPLADAITYGFGDLGLILFLTWLGPKIMRADLKREAKELEAKLSRRKAAAASRVRRALRRPRLRASRMRSVAGSTTRGAGAAVCRRAAVRAARAARRRVADSSIRP